MKPTYTLSPNWPKTVFWLLLIFTLFNTIATLIGEAFKTHLIWYFRFADVVEILVNSAFYLISLVLFYELFWQVQAATAFRRLFAVLTILFFIGHVMHFTANTINCFATEIHDYRALIPNDLYALIYFMDETLSHVILYLSRYGILACLLILETAYLARQAIVRSLWIGGLVVGLLYGLWEAIVFIEGQKVWLVPVAIILLGLTWIWVWRRSHKSLPAFIKTGPITAFVTVELPCLVIGLIVYLVIMGSFVQPSQLGG